MSMKIHPLFQNSLETTETWIDDVITELDYDDRAGETPYCHLHLFVSDGALLLIILA